VRVLLTIHHELDADSGAPGVTVQLADALRGLGHEAEVFSWSDLPEPLGARAREASFPAWASARIRRAAAGGEVDVVDASTCDAWPWLVARRGLGAERRGPAVLTRTHGLEHAFREAREASGEPIGLLERAYHGYWRLRETELTLRLADAALFLNAGDRERAVRELGVRPERAHVVPNGIPDRFAELAPPAPRPEGAPLRLVQLGSWDPRKGIAATVAAAGAVLASRPGVELRLLGTGPVDDAAVRAAFPAAAGERVTVTPRFGRGELPGLLAECDVLLQPSLAEGFSLALLEGMACGLAPVASRVGAAPDVVVPEQSGLLVEPGDAAGLRAALERLADDRPLVERLRAGAHAAARGYGWSRVATGMAELYERVRAAR
jgi:glycosyltransferase involved in cell wall biosynthesis